MSTKRFTELQKINKKQWQRNIEMLWRHAGQIKFNYIAMGIEAICVDMGGNTKLIGLFNMASPIQLAYPLVGEGNWRIP